MIRDDHFSSHEIKRSKEQKEDKKGKKKRFLYLKKPSRKPFQPVPSRFLFSYRESKSKKSKEAVRYALAHLSEKEAAFSHQEMLTVALTQVLGEMTNKPLQEALKVLENKGELLRGERKE